MTLEELIRNRLNSNFKDEEQDQIIKDVDIAIREFNKLNSKSTYKPDNKALNDFLNRLIEKPEIIPSIISAFKGTRWPSFWMKVTISLIVVIPITYLSSQGVLGTCETSTLFGGIVGYLLGELT